MTAYQLDFCGQGNRIIVHPKGLPPGWRESNLDPETQRKAHRKVEEIVAVKYVQSRHIIHLNPETLELIEVFPLQ